MRQGISPESTRRPGEIRRHSHASSGFVMRLGTLPSCTVATPGVVLTVEDAAPHSLIVGLGDSEPRRCCPKRPILASWYKPIAGGEHDRCANEADPRLFVRVTREDRAALLQSNEQSLRIRSIRAKTSLALLDNPFDIPKIFRTESGTRIGVTNNRSLTWVDIHHQPMQRTRGPTQKTRDTRHVRDRLCDVVRCMTNRDRLDGLPTTLLPTTKPTARAASRRQQVRTLIHQWRGDGTPTALDVRRPMR